MTAYRRGPGPVVWEPQKDHLLIEPTIEAGRAVGFRLVHERTGRLLWEVQSASPDPQRNVELLVALDACSPDVATTLQMMSRLFADAANRVVRYG